MSLVDYNDEKLITVINKIKAIDGNSPALVCGTLNFATISQIRAKFAKAVDGNSFREYDLRVTITIQF